MDLPSHKAHSSQAKDSADLSHSRLIEVPADLFRLHHLRTLRLDNNSLSSVPWSSLMALESLTHVNLSHNKLSELPEALAKWNTVEVLDVSYNCIAAFSQALRPLLLRAYYIIPLRPFVYTSGSIYHIRFDHEDYTLECPHLTRALIKQFGSKLPAILHAQYPSRYHYSRASMAVVAANPQIEIMDYASSSPHIFWQPSWASSTALRSVRPGKPYWKLAAGASPRVRLEGNPVLDKMPRLETEPTALAAEWEADASTRGEQGSGSDSDSDDEPATDRKKDTRENTRKVRREQRHKAKGNSTARDAKFGGAP